MDERMRRLERQWKADGDAEAGLNWARGATDYLHVRSMRLREVCGPATRDLWLPAVERLYDMAAGSWCGCYWTHELRIDGEVVLDAAENPIYCNGTDEECSYCAKVAASSDSADSLGALAMDSAQSGDLWDASEAASGAATEEARWGAAPTWGRLATLLLGLVQAVDEAAAAAAAEGAVEDVRGAVEDVL